MFDPTKVAALKALGFSDADITNLQTQAEATEKAASDQQIAYKAAEPAAALPDVVINGVTYKALPPSPPTTADMAEKDDGEGDMEVMAEEPADEPMDENALTLSQGDLAAIGEAISNGIAQVMGALDLEKKVAGHVQGLLAPYQATKDAEQAERDEKIAQLQTTLKESQDQQAALKAQLDELLGLQPAVPQRPSADTTTLINPFKPTDQQLLAAVKEQLSPDQVRQHSNGFEDLTKNLFGQ